jgi:two-component system CheB/CheR fusion protein
MEPKAGSGNKTTKIPLVGIGASAGGIMALQSLFQALRPDSNLTFVVIQHLLPGKPSRLTKIIANRTAMRVCQAEEGIRPERNCVYIASPNDVLTLENGVFHIRPFEGGARRPGIDTIDAFFESLAEDCGPNAIAVVLSGTGTDGAAGAIRIKQAGGMVFAQDPVTALHDGMPLAVIEADVADHILPVGGIAQELAACASPSYVRPTSAMSPKGAVSETLNEIIALMRKQIDFDMSGYKPSPLLWRIQQRMDQRRVKTFENYRAQLMDDPAELETLVRHLPIHVTEFLRDREAWSVLEKKVLVPLIYEKRNGPIRAWTPACATGEEAYSLTMLLAEQAQAAVPPLDFQVFATDAAPEILARPGRGVFSLTAVEPLPAERRERFFYTADGA